MSHPLLYQINTRIYLQELGETLGRRASMEDIAESELENFVRHGFKWVWFLGVWQTGPKARMVSRSSEKIVEEGKAILPDFTEDDISGSPFAIQSYTPRSEYGGDASLKRLRQRLHRHGLKLMLDFVPNHVGPDHEWLSTHSEFFISGTEEDLKREPQNWGRFETSRGTRIFAYGRDPYFPGWTDTVQLNYRHPALRQAMIEVLEGIAERSDGVRCDMAMLVEPDIFKKTWGDRAIPNDGHSPVDVPFWPTAIAGIKEKFPEFVLMAEVYWDLEGRMQQHGFDYTYDKRLYDRLVSRDTKGVREHLMAEPEFQNHSARFLENHDEPRAAAVLSSEQHRAAAIITYFIPGLRFFHEGQFEGRKVHVSMHLGRRPKEDPDPGMISFYDAVLQCLHRLELHQGMFQSWQPMEAWPGNPTWTNFVAFSWKGEAHSLLFGVVNYSPTQGQCYVPIHVDHLAGMTTTLFDLLSAAQYERSGDDLKTRGLYLDLPAWGYHLFSVDQKNVELHHQQAARPIISTGQILVGA